jgi:Family of unknown function (DUF6092)
LMVVEADDGAVLSEAAAMEVLAYLITAARTQVDEAAEYAPMRLITAAQKLGRHLAAGATDPIRELVEVLDTFAPTSTPRTDRAAYVARLDALCEALADCLLVLAGSPPSR